MTWIRFILSLRRGVDKALEDINKIPLACKREWTVRKEDHLGYD